MWLLRIKLDDDVDDDGVQVQRRGKGGGGEDVEGSQVVVVERIVE